MTEFFYNLLVFFTWLTPGHYVWIAIVIITIILRLIFLKPTIKMTLMQYKQKELQPHLEKIKNDHKGDKQAEQKATLELYKQHGVNPLASCLPMLVQIVVLIFFYRVFIKIGIDVLKPEYLYSWLPRPASINSSFFGYDLSQTVAQLFKLGGLKGYLALLFPLVTGGTQLYQSIQMRATQPKPTPGSKEDTFQRMLSSQMTYLFPIMTAYISYTLTSALSIYWATQTILMILQQFYIIKRYKPKVAAVACPPGCAPAQTFKKGDVEVTVRKRG